MEEGSDDHDAQTWPAIGSSKTSSCVYWGNARQGNGKLSCQPRRVVVSSVRPRKMVILRALGTDLIFEQVLHGSCLFPCYKLVRLVSLQTSKRVATYGYRS